MARTKATVRRMPPAQVVNRGIKNNLFFQD